MERNLHAAAPAASPGDGTRFEECYQAHYRQSLRMAWALAGSHAIGEELCQEGWKRAYERWETVGRLDRPYLWVARVIKNLAISRWRRSGVEMRYRHRLRKVESVGACAPQDDVVERMAVLGLVKALPERQRVAVAAHYLAGLSQSEAAALVGCNESTFRVHLHRARRKLAEWLEEEARRE